MKFKILLLLATILLLSCEQNEKINSNSNQELDHKILLDLFSEIETIAYSYSCEDEGEWFFTQFALSNINSSNINFDNARTNFDMIDLNSNIETSVNLSAAEVVSRNGNLNQRYGYIEIPIEIKYNLS